MIAEFPRLFRSRSADRRGRIHRLTLAFVTYVLGNPKHQASEGAPLPRRRESVTPSIADPAHPWSGAKFAEMTADEPRRAESVVPPLDGGHPDRVHPASPRSRGLPPACLRLMRPSRSIANAVGFPDRFYFSRVFKKHTNVPPAEYRKGRGAGK